LGKASDSGSERMATQPISTKIKSYRVAQDVCCITTPLGKGDAIMYWSMFLGFLIHNNFPKNTPIRQAVSIVLTDVIQALIRCGHHDLANQCLPE